MKWLLKPAPAGFDASDEPELPAIVARLLASRGYTDSESIDRFLNPSDDQLHDPYRILGMRQAVERTKTAIAQKEKIMVFGDYDVDGITSAAILSRYLKSKQANYFVMLPQRHTHGYDFGEHAWKRAVNDQVDLLICVDCGSNSSHLRAVALHGIDVIVIDHHEIDAAVDIECLTVLNPKRPQSTYPFRDLTGGALVFKFISAILGRPYWEEIDLAALSIVCDVAPLIDENRVMVKRGIEKLRRDPHAGLSVLMQIAKVNPAYVDTFHIGWRLGPRLNASGRIADASVSFDLLMTDDEEEANEIAGRIENMNNERRALTDEVRALAELQAKSAAHKDDHIHVLSGEAWNAGVVGIVASNIKESCARPAIVVSFENGMGKGSGRSIAGFNILEALEHCGKYLAGFGGHARACGIEIKKENIDAFRIAINEFASSRLQVADLTPILELDGSVSFFEITDAVAEMLVSFAPYGEANREPLLSSYNVRLKNVTDFYTAQKTLWFEQSNDHATRILPARIFKNNPLLNTIKCGESYDIAFAVQYEQRNSSGTVSLQLKDIRKAQG